TNEALDKKPWRTERIEDVIARARQENDKFLFNQAAQVWNHTFFWNCMTPKKVAPEAAFAAGLEEAFGDFNDFKAAFIEKGEKHFGSGYVWLVAEAGGKLKLIEGHDAETPAAQAAVTPVLGCDLWEHAYYLDHKNARPAYLKTFLNDLANWRFAAGQWAAARGEGKAWEHPRAIAKLEA
ncbi:MAG TPA: superoxide dismutase, partial [Caulobacterales bacterium]|nr:superoxide dismutase [Caulobacterales bacterium]